MNRRIHKAAWGACCIASLALAGCGGETSDTATAAAVGNPAGTGAAASSSTPATASSQAGESSSRPMASGALASLPTASITAVPSAPRPQDRNVASEPAAANPPSTAPAVSELPAIPFSKEGTPEWRMYEIARLMAPPPTQKEVIGEDGATRVVDRTPQEITSDRKASLREVVGHAGQVIAATHADAQQESLFTNAVHYLCSAHVELAILGEADSARQLGEVAEAIYREKPKSQAAVTSSDKLVELARGMAQLYGDTDAEWIRAHVTQARLFAERFPEAEPQAPMALLLAGRSAERGELLTEARQCYQLLSQNYPDTPFAEEIVGVLRRLQLQGRVLAAGDLGGATIDGGYVSIEQFRGKHVLVVFWTTDSPTFESDLPVIQQLQADKGDGLVVLGINLDQDEFAVDQFMEKHAIGWRQIFDPNPELRGTRNAVASYYGVTTVPLYWLIDPDGKVAAAPADIRKLPL